MWLVKNLLRGSLKFSGLGIEIPPREEFDLDTLGREMAEKSNQLIVAFEEGYLQNIQKGESEVPVANITITSHQGNLSDSLSSFEQDFLKKLQASFPDMINEGMLAELKDSIIGDLGSKMDLLRKKILLARQSLIENQDLSDAEIQARLLFLTEQEKTLESHFNNIGTKTFSQTKKEDIQEKANQLDGLLEAE